MGMFVHHTGMGYNLKVLDLAQGKKRHNSSDPQLVFILFYQAGLIPPEKAEVASFSYSVVEYHSHTTFIGFLIELSKRAFIMFLACLLLYG